MYIFICTFIYLGKLIITTGYPRDIGIHSEVIDIVHSNITCKSLTNFPVQISQAFGGVLENNIPIVCGGWSDNYKYAQSNCYIIGKEGIATTMSQPRFFGASAVISKDTLWITGGTLTEQSTDFIKFNQASEPGPDLPMKFLEHCMVKINENLVVLIGGIDNQNQAQSLIVEVSKNFSMSQGPSLIQGRYDFSCGLFELNGNPAVIVAGGYDGFNSISTEIWVQNSSNNGWLVGPKLLEPCSGSSMITSPSGEGVILLGCREHKEAFYELNNSNGILSWRKMKQQLKYPRSDTVAMLVPDELVSCST